MGKRKWAGLLLGLAAAAAVAGIFFALTFNVDRFRPLVVRRLEEALGRPVDLERIAIGWREGAAFTLDGLEIYADETARRNRQPAVRAQQASAVLEIRPLLKGDLRIHSIRIQGAIQLVPPGQPGFEGKFFCWFDVSGKEVLRTKDVRDLSAGGRIRLEEGRIRQFNLLRELFDRLTVIPGLTAALLARLPPSDQGRISAPDTVLQPVEGEVVLREGVLHFKDLRVATDSFELQGSGRIGLDGSLRFPAQIRVEPALSAAITRSVKELRLLADENGRLVMPVLVQGRLSQLSVGPDLEYVTRRLLTSKAEELLGGLLERVLDYTARDDPS